MDQLDGDLISSINRLALNCLKISWYKELLDVSLNTSVTSQKRPSVPPASRSSLTCLPVFILSHMDPSVVLLAMISFEAKRPFMTTPFIVAVK